MQNMYIKEQLPAENLVNIYKQLFDQLNLVGSLYESVHEGGIENPNEYQMMIKSMISMPRLGLFRKQ